MRRLIGLKGLLPLLLLVLLSVISSNPVRAVRRHEFKTCAQSGFCRRNRALADRAGEHKSTWTSPYTLSSPSFRDGSLHASISNALFPAIKFSLEVRIHQDGAARILMDEIDGLRQRYNEAGMWAVQTTPLLAEDSDVHVTYATGETRITYGPGHRHELRLEHSPILLTFSRDGQPHVVLNERGLLNMEHFRVKQIGKDSEEVVVQDETNPGQQTVIIKEQAFPGFLPTDEDGMWEETFGGKTDPKPKGGHRPDRVFTVFDSCCCAQAPNP